MSKTSSQTAQSAPAAEAKAAPLEPIRRFSIAKLATGGRPLVTISAKPA